MVEVGDGIYIYYIPYIKLVKMFANSNQPGCQINFVLLGSPEIGPAQKLDSWQRFPLGSIF